MHELILSLILSTFAPAPAPAIELPRLDGIATDIASIVATTDRLPFTGPAAADATAVLLVSIGEHESAFRSGVQDCSLCDGSTARCDHGRSVSIYQLQRPAFGGFSREDVCEDNWLATYLALRWVRRSVGKTHLETLRSYAGCQPDLECPNADSLATRFEQLAKRAGLRPCGGRCWRR